MGILIIFTLIYATLLTYSVYNLCTDFYADRTYKLSMITFTTVVFIYLWYIVYKAVM